MMQHTFGTIVGLDPIMPIATLPNDLVACADTNDLLRYADCIFSWDGKAFSEEEARDEHDEDALRAFFEACEEQVNDYYSNGDGADSYAHLVSEDMTHMRGNVDQWLDDAFGDCDDFPECMVDDFCEALVDNMEFSVSHGYFGSPGLDVTFDSYDIGEQEEQIDISDHELLTDLHDQGRLEGLLENLYREFCFSDNSKWDEATKMHIRGPIISPGKYPCVMFYVNTNMWHHFGCSDEKAREVWKETAKLLFYRVYRCGYDYAVHPFYRPSFVDFDGSVACEAVAKSNGWDSAEFVNHGDLENGDGNTHRQLLNFLIDLRDNPDLTDNETLLEWAEEAISDAELDYEDTFGREYNPG